MLGTRSYFALITLLSVATFSISAVPAQAAPTQSDVVAALIDEVRPDVVVNEPLTTTETGWETSSAELAIPNRSDEVIEVDGISVKLPGDGTAGRIASDETVVFGEEDGIRLAVQADAEGARIHTVVTSAREMKDFVYEVNGATPVLLEDGSILLYGDGSEENQAIIAAPWARDAEGTELETWYVVEGNRVIQKVKTTESTVFPIVADPSISFGKLIYLKFNKSETKRVAAIETGDATAVASTICAIAGTAIGAGCALTVNLYYPRVLKTFKEAKKANKCVQLGWNYGPVSVLVSWKVVSC